VVVNVEEGNEHVGMELLTEKIFNQFGYVADIYVAHLLSPSEIARLHITVHTGEAESFEEYLDLTSSDEVTIDAGGTEPLSLPFDVMVTVDGAGHIQGTEGTTVYMADNVMGAKHREVDTGLSILRQKLADVCPSCGEKVELFGDHHRESRSCREAERL
jgi:hypothetical protein